MKRIVFVFFLLVALLIVYQWRAKNGLIIQEKIEEITMKEKILPTEKDQNISQEEQNRSAPISTLIQEEDIANLSFPPPMLDQLPLDQFALEENFTIAPRWQTMAERLSDLGAQMGDAVFIRIFKYSAELELWIKINDRYEWLQTYGICKQSGYLGPKLTEGDKQGPEGFYAVTKDRLNPNSRFHLAFNIGYPNAFDRAHFRTGSALMVHGDCVSIGCFAMTDEKIEEIYELVEKAFEGGQDSVPVHIFPFRMTDKKMEHYHSSQWFDFWSNLKEGYDYFEEKGLPPDVEVEKKRYIFD